LINPIIVYKDTTGMTNHMITNCHFCHKLFYTITEKVKL